MIIWLMMALTAGGLVFAGVIFWALRVYYTKNYHRFFHLERKEWTDSRQRFWKER